MKQSPKHEYRTYTYATVSINSKTTQTHNNATDIVYFKIFKVAIQIWRLELNASSSQWFYLWFRFSLKNGPLIKIKIAPKLRNRMFPSSDTFIEISTWTAIDKYQFIPNWTFHFLFPPPPPPCYLEGSLPFFSKWQIPIHPQLNISFSPPHPRPWYLEGSLPIFFKSQHLIFFPSSSFLLGRTNPPGIIFDLCSSFCFSDICLGFYLLANTSAWVIRLFWKRKI